MMDKPFRMDLRSDEHPVPLDLNDENAEVHKADEQAMSP